MTLGRHILRILTAGTLQQTSSIRVKPLNGFAYGIERELTAGSKTLSELRLKYGSQGESPAE